MSPIVNVGSKDVVTIHRGNRSIVIPIPYTMTLGGVNFADIFYLVDPIEDSFTDGVWVGVINGASSHKLPV